MKITLEYYGSTYTVEDDGSDHDANEMKETFSRLLVQAGFPPSVIDCADGGRYEVIHIAEE